jgi:hypothetical protein
MIRPVFLGAFILRRQELRKRRSSYGPYEWCSVGFAITTPRSPTPSHTACLHPLVTPQMSASSSVFAVDGGPSRAVQRFSPLVMHSTDGVDNDVAKQASGLSTTQTDALQFVQGQYGKTISRGSLAYWRLHRLVKHVVVFEA